jgi:hypothetical protein
MPLIHSLCARLVRDPWLARSFLSLDDSRLLGNRERGFLTNNDGGRRREDIARRDYPVPSGGPDRRLRLCTAVTTAFLSPSSIYQTRSTTSTGTGRSFIIIGSIETRHQQ